MDTTLMLKLGKILMYVVSGLITLGFIWDFCVFVRKHARIELKNTSKYLIFLIRSFRGGDWWGGGGREAIQTTDWTKFKKFKFQVWN
jgi:hypothetical protein